MGKHLKRHRIPTTWVEGFAIREVRPSYWLVDINIGGQRYRTAFKDYEQAKTYCRVKRQELIKGGTDALKLAENTRADALKAVEILNPLGATLVQAAMEYAKRHPATACEPFRQTCDRYLADMEKNGRRPASIVDKRTKFNRLCDGLGDRQTTSVDHVDVQEWIDANGYTNGTARAYAGAVKTLLAFHRGENLRLNDLLRRSYRNVNGRAKCLSECSHCAIEMNPPPTNPEAPENCSITCSAEKRKRVDANASKR